MKFPQHPLSSLHLGFPGFTSPVAGNPVEPARLTVKATMRRLGCNDNLARSVALQLRAILALREAEEAGDLRHVRELVELVASDRLIDPALPESFFKRLVLLQHDLANGVRGRGRPPRTAAERREILEAFKFYRTDMTYEASIEQIAWERELSAEAVTKILPRKGQPEFAEPTIYSAFDPDFDRFFVWAKAVAAAEAADSPTGK